MNEFDNRPNFDKHISSDVKGKDSLSLARMTLKKQFIHLLVQGWTTMPFVAVAVVGLTKSFVSFLQRVQNSAAQILTGTSRREHITPVLLSLNWLPFRCDLKHFFVRC